MKQPRTSRLPLAIARTGSLLHRLQTAPGQKDQPYLDQLMTFLENPPPDVRDRWKEGAQMCSAWGITCTGTSVWRLYRTWAIAWRLRLANESAPSLTESAGHLDEKVSQMVALRTFEVLAHPDIPPASLIGLARIESRNKVLAFARQQYEDEKRAQREKALEGKIAGARFLETFVATMKSMEPPVQPQA